jgi:hypothetical protein
MTTRTGTVTLTVMSAGTVMTRGTATVTGRVMVTGRVRTKGTVTATTAIGAMTEGKGITGTGITVRAGTTTGRSTSIRPMPRLSRRAGTVGLALTIWDVWQRIPPRHRKQIVKHARKHGPRLAALLVQTQARRRRSP